MDEEIEILKMFIRHMMKKSILPCRIFVGDDPEILSPEEIRVLLVDFVDVELFGKDKEVL